MKSILLLVALVGLAAAVFTEQEYQASFTSWMHDNEKTYTAEDFQTRFDIFKSNMDYIQAWNSNNNQTVLGLTPLADLTNEEYRTIYLGTRFNGAARLAAALNEPEEASFAPMADTVNWVEKGAVTGIKDQGQCGSCWSFSTTGSVEGVHYLTTSNLVSFSEQNLMDCSGSYGNQGCNGGLMDNAFRYIIANKGLDTEASYPYRATQGTCAYKAANSGGTIAAFADVKAGSESALVTAINKNPISVAIDASHNSFQLYKSGVYYEPACSASNLDHGVLAVGYGSDAGADYYLVKNSWGTSWGQTGYIWMARNRNNNCGIATMSSYPTA